VPVSGTRTGSRAVASHVSSGYDCRLDDIKYIIDIHLNTFTWIGANLIPSVTMVLTNVHELAMLLLISVAKYFGSGSLFCVL